MLALQSIYEFKLLIDGIKELHPTYKRLLEEFEKMEPLLDMLALHFKVMMEVIVAGKEKKLEDILCSAAYDTIKEHYILNIKNPTTSTAVLEESLKYIINNLFIQFYKLLRALDKPKPSINLDDAAVDVHIIVNDTLLLRSHLDSFSMLLEVEAGDCGRVSSKNNTNSWRRSICKTQNSSSLACTE